MLTRFMIVACASIVCAFNHSALFAQQESKSWVPRIFSSSDDKATSGTTSRSSSNVSNSASDSSWWLPWKSESKPKVKSTKPNGSMIGRMGRTTKNFWDNSLDFINPFNDKPKPKPQQGYVPQNIKPKTSGGFFGWLSPQEETEIRSVNDFLSLPMPQ